jgi:hypothetical protein
VLRELAEAVPAFAAAKAGVPAYGLDLEAKGPAADGLTGFVDAWLAPRKHKGDRPGEPSPKGSKNA